MLPGGTGENSEPRAPARAAMVDRPSPGVARAAAAARGGNGDTAGGIAGAGEQRRHGSLFSARVATVADLERMEATAREFYASSRFLHGFQLSRFVALWTHLLGTGGGVIFVLGSQDIDGALGGVVYPEPYSGVLVATEFFWFVRPGCRGAGMRLYRAFEAWARARGCAQIRMVHLTDSMPERLAEVYGRLGYEAAEVHYVKELRP